MYSSCSEKDFLSSLNSYSSQQNSRGKDRAWQVQQKADISNEVYIFCLINGKSSQSLFTQQKNYKQSSLPQEGSHSEKKMQKQHKTTHQHSIMTSSFLLSIDRHCLELSRKISMATEFILSQKWNYFYQLEQTVSFQTGFQAVSWSSPGSHGNQSGEPRNPCENPTTL